MSGARTQYHRSGQSSLPVQPVVRLFTPLRDAVPCEEFRCNARGSSLIGHSLCAIFAKLKRMPVAIWIRPRTARAIEPGLLVDSQPGARHPHRTHLAQPISERMKYRRYPRCYFGDGGYLHFNRFGNLIRYDAMTTARCGGSLGCFTFIAPIDCHRVTSWVADR